MARIPALLRLSPRYALASNAAFFAKAIAKAASKPPSPPTTTSSQNFSSQVATSVQSSGSGPTFHQVQTTNSGAPFPGYGVYSPEYLETMGLSVSLNQNDPLFLTSDHAAEGYHGPYLDIPVTDPIIDDTDTIDEEAAEDAAAIAEDVAEGKSLDLIADEREISRQEVQDLLEEGGHQVEVNDWGLENDNITRTEITDPETGETIHEYYDNDSNRYWVKVVDEEGEELSASDVRDDQGRKVTISQDDETGGTTTRYEDDWGDGEVVEVTELPDGDVVVTKTTDTDGNTETIVTMPDEDGEAEEIVLDSEQGTSREDIDEIAEAVAAGKSIDALAEEQGLTREQIIAQLAAAGFRVSEWADSHDNVTRRIVDTQSGEDIARYHFSMESMARSTLHVDADGNETTRTEYRDGRSVETVVEDNGRKTVTSESADGDVTTRVTHNGYTVTTPPDGDITVRHDEDGTEIDVERGTYEASLVETLLGIDLDSSDPEEAMAAEIVMAVIEGLIAGESVSDLQESIEEKQEELDQAIEDYGEGHPPGENATPENPYGDPPQGEAPSGGEWVPMYGAWLDPEVAKAMAALNVLIAQQLESNSKGLYHQAQLDVFALDPEYEGAVERAGEILDEALVPHDRRWIRPEPEGTLEEAEERLSEAEDRLGETNEARVEYQEAQRALGEAITKQDNMPYYPDGTVTEFIGQEGDSFNHDEEVKKGEAAHAEVDLLFSEAALHNSNGDNALATYMVKTLEQHPDASDPESDIFRALDEARETLEGTESQVEISQAYYDYYEARSEDAEFAVDVENLSNRLVQEYNANNEHLFEEGRKHKTVGGKYLGEFTGQELDYRDGQLWVINHFEGGRTTEQQLTDDPHNERGLTEESRQRPLNVEWHELNTGVDMTGDICRVDSPVGASVNLDLSTARLYETLSEQIGANIEEWDEIILDLEGEERSFIGELGEGEKSAPQDILAPGEEPITVSYDGHDIWIAPGSEEDYEQGGLEVLAERDESVGVNVDGEWLWVHSDQAITMIALREANSQRDILEESQSDTQTLANWYRHRASQPVDLLEERESPEQNARMHFSYLNDSTGQALNEIYQPHFQEKLNQDEVADFVRIDNDAQLEDIVARHLNIDLSSSEGQDVVNKVIDEIYDQGGDDPEVKVVPFFYVDKNVGMVENALFAVRTGGDEERYVDATGKHFGSLEDFQDHNRQFDENGLIVAPKSLELEERGNGSIALEVVQARNISRQEKIIDPLVGIGTAITSVGMVIPNPLSPFFAGATLLGTTYLGGRTLQNQVDHVKRGGEWLEKESLMNMGMIATTLLPMGSGMSRGIGLAKANGDISVGRAFFANMGMTRSSSTQAMVTGYMRSTTGWNLTARVMDKGAIGTGIPVMAVSAYDLAIHGDEMSSIQRADAIMGLGTGFAGTVVGAYGISTIKPTHSKSSNAGLPNVSTSGTTLPSSSTPPVRSMPDPLSAKEQTSGRVVHENTVAGETDPSSSSTVRDISTPSRTEGVEASPTFSSALITSLRPVEIRALTGSEVGRITPEHLSQVSKGRITAFTPEQVSFFTKEQIGALTNDQVRKLTIDQVRALSPEQMSFFKREQLAAMRPKQIGALKGDQLASLSAFQLRALSGTQLRAISPDGLAQIKGNRLMWLLPEQVASLTPRQVSALTTKQVRFLTPGQVSKMTRAQLSALTSQQWSAFRFNQLGRLDSELLQLAPHDVLVKVNRPGTISHTLDAEGKLIQLHGGMRLSEQGIIAPSAEPYNSNNYKQRTIVISREALVPLLNAEAVRMIPRGDNIRVLVNIYEPPLPGQSRKTTAFLSSGLGTLVTAGATVGQGSILPDGFKAPIQAGAFLVRGISLAVRSLSPNMTAVDTRFGRILRGVEAVTFSINLPQSYMNTLDGNGVVGSGSFSIANSFYLAKSYTEAVTGKPFMPHTDDIGSPLYIFGSNDIAISSVGDIATGNGGFLSYIDALSGGLFIYGAGAGWLQAPGYQTRGTNPSPRSESSGNNSTRPSAGDVASEAPKPQTKRDYTTAITFGGGLGLFALSTFLGDLARRKDDGDGETSLPEFYGEPRPQFVTQPFGPVNPIPASVAPDVMHSISENSGLGLAELTGGDGGGGWPFMRGQQEDDGIGSQQGSYMVEISGQHEAGRFNPDLSGDYDEVIVQEGQTLGGIAMQLGYDVMEVVELNMHHISDPGVLVAGDRIYLPKMT